MVGGIWEQGDEGEPWEDKSGSECQAEDEVSVR